MPNFPQFSSKFISREAAAKQPPYAIFEQKFIRSSISMSEIVPKWDKISAKLYKSGLRTKLIHSSISAKGWKPCLGCSKLLLLTKNGKSVHTLPNSDHSASTHEPRGTNAVPTPVRCPAPKPSYTRIRLDSIYCPAECQFFPMKGWLGSQLRDPRCRIQLFGWEKATGSPLNRW